MEILVFLECVWPWVLLCTLKCSVFQLQGLFVGFKLNLEKSKLNIFYQRKKSVLLFSVQINTLTSRNYCEKHLMQWETVWSWS